MCWCVLKPEHQPATVEQALQCLRTCIIGSRFTQTVYLQFIVWQLLHGLDYIHRRRCSLTIFSMLCHMSSHV